LSYLGWSILRQSRGVAEEDRKDCERVAHDDVVVGGEMVGWRGGGFGPSPLPRVYTNYEKTALSRTVLGESCGETISFTVGVLCSECPFGLKRD
jgi:hypothetical protein